ncbi:MAG TPA: isoprenylcysteine carboxylmethyltransferase family protein [Planctomycetaceae bacterium]|jgi:protein-S-isoprenylcysteine O-methyltransferase Ste14|nr:isoprenylcysteine carboxylmethyltransferase family protein [Planctomycetaceae bacterium]
MEESTEVQPSAQSSVEPRPTPAVQIGPVRLRGIPAVIAFAVISAAIVALIIYSQPRPTVLVSAAIWFALDIYWSVAEVQRRAAKTAESRESRRLHGRLIMAALLLLFLPIPGLTGQFVPDTLATGALGLALQVGSALFYFWCRLYLGRMWSGAVRIVEDHKLIESGPYRVLRHPMYTGMLGMCVGTAIVSGQYHALLGVGLFAFAYARKIRIEERILCEEFGATYDAYRRRTSALVPWVF